MENTKQNPQKTPTIKERLAQLNKVGKNTMSIGLAALIGLIGGICIRGCHSAKIKSPAKERVDTTKALEDYPNATEERIRQYLPDASPKITGAARWLTEISVEAAGAIREKAAEVKARRDKEKE